MRLLIFASAILIAGSFLWVGLAEGSALGQTLRRGNGPEVETLDPHKAEGVSAANVLRDLYEGLVAEGPEGSIRPGVAERWTVDDRGETYTFFLRRDAKWSNGDSVTAQDFVAGLRRSADPVTGSAYSQILVPIKNAELVIAGTLPSEQLGVRALDDYTLQIRLKGPTPYLLGLLSHASTYPIHRPSLAALGPGFTQAGKLVGNGAYRLVERVVQSHLLLERNENYWNDAQTRIDRVRYINSEDINSELKRFRAGELDWTYQIPANQGAWIREHLRDSYHVNTYLGVYYYGLNLSRPPFKDAPKLRQALSLAIDRDVIAHKVLGSGERPASSWVPDGVAGYVPSPAPWTGLSRSERLEEARRLYAEAGYSAEHPARVEIRYNTHDDHRKIATAVAAMWKQWLGVETELINEEWKVYLQNRRLKTRTQIFRAGWIGDYNDPNSFLEILHSTHGLNDSAYRNVEYDGLIERAAVQGDSALRMDLLRQAERILLEDLPVIPIYFYVTKRLVSPRVRGWQENIMDHHPTQYLRLVYPPTAPASGSP